MTRERSRALIGQLVAARNAGSRSDAGRLLGTAVRYWDCRGGEVEGRDRVAAALTDPLGSGARARFDLETLAADPDCAVAELRVSGTAASGSFAFRTTEVYAIDEGSVVSCRAYLDPAELPEGG